MCTALLSLLLVGAQPCVGCCDPVNEQTSWHPYWADHVTYYERLYKGHFDRHPFDYRFQYDYPWHAGPSQPRWPIPPLPTPPDRPWLHEIPFGHEPTGWQSPSCPRVDIAPVEGFSQSHSEKGEVSLKLRSDSRGPRTSSPTLR